MSTDSAVWSFTEEDDTMRVSRVEKPWGYELLLAHTERYAGKIICIRAGERLSLQHHTVKDETLFLLEGDVDLELQADAEHPVRRRMRSDESYHVHAGRKHRLAALSEARVLEFSTPELDDVVRWEDDYGRAPARGGRQQEVALPEAERRIYLILMQDEPSR
jgi:mannose-6-phosphate isomerase